MLNKRLSLLFLSLCCATCLLAQHPFGEQQMQDSLLQMLARFTTYMKNDFQPCQEPNSVGESCGCFRSNNTMRSNEDGVRSNADMGMVCAFLCKYARGKVTLPQDVSWDDVEQMAMKSLVFAYSTHKANKLKPCSDGRYWGSVSERDHVWESSLWAMSVAYSALFLWDKLSEQQHHYIYKLLTAECDYELERKVPTGYMGDTKAEENGWEVDVLASALALFPNDARAPRWRERMYDFAINSYSHPDDENDTTMVYDGKRVCDLYRGANLYPDYTLQNHNYFHTSYQNVVIQELGEAALIEGLTKNPPPTPYGREGTHPQPLPNGRGAWSDSSAAKLNKLPSRTGGVGGGLLHNCREVCDSVLWWLALSDGELAMPNGNDWSLFLYDQMTSYSTMACMLRDADALMLERRAFEMIRLRQSTTPDGSWLPRSDIGARRMGVQAHRVMMTWLMHHVWPTGNLQPTAWEEFRLRHSAARLLPCQKVVRASTPHHFTCFSWSEGLKSYTGYFAPTGLSTVASPPAPLQGERGVDTLHRNHKAQNYLLPSPLGEGSGVRLLGEGSGVRLPDVSHNIVVPYKAHNTGNLLGWYEVEGRATNAVPAAEPQFELDGECWTVRGHLLCNDGALDVRFTLHSTSDNALVYTDTVRALADCTIRCEKGGLLAISEDESTSQHRRYAFSPGRVSIDDCVTITVSPAKQMKVDAPRDVNSVLTALLYASYDDRPRHYSQGELVDCRRITFNTVIPDADGIDLFCRNDVRTK